MKKITFLGPVGATFSHDAYSILAKLYGAPPVEASEANCVPASNNGEILQLILAYGGYGAIAMETLAEGRVAEPLESFIDLLKTYNRTDDYPLRIIGAVKMNIRFCLMARKAVLLPKLGKVLAHPKALGACRSHIAMFALETVGVSSNGEAARLVAETDEYAGCGALGPKSAAKKYNLQVLDGAFEDGEAITTFFLIGPKEHKVSVGKGNRALIVFKAPHRPGSLVRSLIPFEREGLNLIQIHSVHAGNHTYNFAIEVEVKETELGAFERAMTSFAEHAERYLSFGPFEVLSK